MPPPPCWARSMPPGCCAPPACPPRSRRAWPRRQRSRYWSTSVPGGTGPPVTWRRSLRHGSRSSARWPTGSGRPGACSTTSPTATCSPRAAPGSPSPPDSPLVPGNTKPCQVRLRLRPSLLAVGSRGPAGSAMIVRVTIVFRLPSFAAERVAFSYSPAMEAVLSLHVLVEPKHYPVQHEWVRAMRRLSPALKREVDVFAFAYRAYFPEFFFPPAAGQLLDFDSELRRLRGVDEQLVRLEFAIPLTGSQATEDFPRDPAALEAPGARRRLRERAAAVGDEALAQQLLDDPRGLLERFLRLLESYWEEAFAREWQRIEPDLAASVSEAGRVIARRGLYALLRGLWPEVRSDPDTGRFWLERPHDHEVDIGAGDLLVLAPSVYVWPHVRVNCDPPWPLGLVFPASSIVRESRPRIP